MVAPATASLSNVIVDIFELLIWDWEVWGRGYLEFIIYQCRCLRANSANSILICLWISQAM